MKTKKIKTKEPKNLMQQLRLTRNDLVRIGFNEQEFGNESRLAIDTLNGCFYYNKGNTEYKWYLRVNINDVYNHILLNIMTIDDLFQLLTFFRIKFNFIK